MRIHKAPKGSDGFTCPQAQSRSNDSSNENPSLKDRMLSHNHEAGKGNAGDSIGKTVGEESRPRGPHNGSVESAGKTFPVNDQYDICNKLNRSDTIADTKAYWLLLNNNSNAKWLFQQD